MNTTELKELTIEELESLLEKIKTEIEERKGQEPKKYKTELRQHNFKRGKAWVQKVNKLGERFEFVDAISVIKQDNHRLSKIFLLPDGLYLTCESGTKSKERRKYIRVENGEAEEFCPGEDE